MFVSFFFLSSVLCWLYVPLSFSLPLNYKWLVKSYYINKVELFRFALVQSCVAYFSFAPLHTPFKTKKWQNSSTIKLQNRGEPKFGLTDRKNREKGTNYMLAAYSSCKRRQATQHTIITDVMKQKEKERKNRTEQRRRSNVIL